MRGLVHQLPPCKVDTDTFRGVLKGIDCPAGQELLFLIFSEHHKRSPCFPTDFASRYFTAKGAIHPHSGGLRQLAHWAEFPKMTSWLKWPPPKTSEEWRWASSKGVFGIKHQAWMGFQGGFRQLRSRAGCDRVWDSLVQKNTHTPQRLLDHAPPVFGKKTKTNASFKCPPGLSSSWHIYTVAPERGSPKRSHPPSTC